MTVTTVVLNYNGLPLLKRFFASVMWQDYPCNVILMDNASTDGSKDWIRKTYPQVKVYESTHNWGTAIGYNLGAMGVKSDYLLFLSNDLWLEKNALSEMMKLMKGNVGIVTCKMLAYSDDVIDKIDNIGGDIDPFGFPQGKYMHDRDFPSVRDSYKVFNSYGSSMLIKTSLFNELGGYDSKFFTLGDDIDLCWRARLLGYTVLATPKAVMYHKGSQTLTLNFKRAFLRYEAEKNTLRTLIKNYGLLMLTITMPVNMAFLVCEAVYFLLKGKPKLAVAGAKAVVWNIRNLKDTLRARKIVQSSRKVKDKDIVKEMYKGSFKIDAFVDSISKPKESYDYFTVHNNID